MRKATTCIGETKSADQLYTDKHFCFRYTVSIKIQSFFLSPKVQASIYCLRFYRLVCVGPGRKPELLVFSCNGPYYRSTFSAFKYHCSFFPSRLESSILDSSSLYLDLIGCVPLAGASGCETVPSGLAL